MGEDHEDPILETLDRSFDPDGGFGQFAPRLMSAWLDTSNEEDELIVWEEDDDDDGIGLMPSGAGPSASIRGRSLGASRRSWTPMRSQPGNDYAGRQQGWQTMSPLVTLEFDERFLDQDEPVLAPWIRMVTGAGAEDTDPGDAAAGHVGWEAARQLPASRTAVEGLQEVVFSEEEASSHGCAVCKDDGIAAGLSVLKLPCKHYFHAECIRPWLAIRNTCPLCRFELPTGDAEYDRRRQSRTRTASVEQQVAPVQSGGASVGGGARMGGGDAAEC